MISRADTNPAMKIGRNIFPYSVLFAILILAAVLRFFALTQQGFLYWDEGMYMNEAKFYASIVDNFGFVVDQVRHGVDLAALEARLDGWPSSAGKPLHGMLIYVCSLIVGLHDYTGQIFSAVCGLLTISVWWWFARRYAGERVAWIAALLIAIAPQHVLLSRSALPEMDANLFFLCVVMLLFVAREMDVRWRRYALYGCAGVALGLTVATNYRFFMMVPMIVVLDVLLWGVPRTRAACAALLARAVCGVAGAVGVCMLMDVPYMFAPSIAARDAIMIGSFAEQVSSYWTRVFSLAERSIDIMSWRPLFVQLYGHFFGWVQCGLLVCATVCVIMRKERSPLMVFAVCVTWYVLLGLTIVKVGYFVRYISVVCVWGLVLAAYGIVWLADRVRDGRMRVVIIAVVLVAIAAQVLPLTFKFVTVSSGYREAFAYMQKHAPEGRMLGYMNSFFEFYGRRNGADMLYNSKERTLAQLAAGDIAYLAIDFGQLSTERGSINVLDRYLRSQRMPEKIIPNPVGTVPEIMLETIHYRDSMTGGYRALLNDPFAGTIRIYAAAGIDEELRRSTME